MSLQQYVMIILFVTAGVSPEQPTANAGHSASSQQTHSEGIKCGVLSSINDSVKYVLSPILEYSTTRNIPRLHRCGIKHSMGMVWSPGPSTLP